MGARYKAQGIGHKERCQVSGVRGKIIANFGLRIGETARKDQGDPSEIGPIDISRGREKRESEELILDGPLKLFEELRWSEDLYFAI